MIENLFTFVRTLGNQRIEGKKFFTTQIGVLGTLSDGTGAVGTAGKVLSSTGSGVEWVTVGSSNVADLDDLTDVVITTASTGQLLRFNGTSWVNWTPNFLTAYGSLNDLSDAVITTPATGQLLRYNGTNWVNWTHNFLTTSANLNDLANVSVAGPTNGQILRYNAGTGLWIADDETEPPIPTLHQVTGAGNTTTNGITAGSFTTTGFISGGNITGTKVTTPTVEFNGAISTNSVEQVDQGDPNPNVFYAKWNGDVQFTVNGDGYAVARTGYKVTGATGGFLKADGTIDTSTYLTSYTETQTLDAVTDLGSTTTNSITVGGLTSTSVTTPLVESSGLLIIDADTTGGLQPDQGDPAVPILSFDWQGNTQGYIDTDGKITFNGFKTPSGTSLGFLKADGSIDTNTYLTSVAPYALDDLVDVNASNPQDGEFLKYDDITGEWISASIPAPTLDSVTTAGNTTANTIDVGGITTPYVQFEEVVTPNATHRSVNWGEDHNSLEVFYADEKHFDVGQDQMWYVKNGAEETLLKGTVVMAVGAVGNSGKIEVAPLVADGTVSGRYAIGILMDDVRSGEFGFAMTQGTIRGIDTSEFTEGDTLYSDPLVDGALTNVEPSSPALKLPIAFVVTSAQNGAIAVRMTQGLDLHEVHDVQITTPSNGQLLRYASGTWENWTPDYLTEETDPVFTASAAATISTTNISNWNTAYGWGNHALAGYLTTYENNYISDVKISEFVVTFTGIGNAFNGDVDFSDLPFAPVTHNHAIAEITGLETALAGKQPIGNYITTETDPTVPDHVKTISEDDILNWNKAYTWGDHSVAGYATESYVSTSIANLVDSAPSTLDTLNELAAALGDDPNFATTVSANIATKVPLSGAATISGMKTFETNVSTQDDWQNSPISILERDSIGIGSTSNIYAPNLNFHWRARQSKSLWLDASGVLRFGEYNSSGVPATDGTIAAATFSGALSGNATTATTLQNTRTINGTNFNGSANITTATWGSARTITIGNTGKSVNGGANVSWTLSEIGAQPAGSYLTAESDTLATVVDRGSSTDSRITVGGLTSSGNIETSANIKAQGYLLFDYDGDFTGSNYYSMEDHSGGYFRMGYAFNSHLVISTSGNVGIGTTAPASKLHVFGDGIFENGTIGAGSRYYVAETMGTTSGGPNSGIGVYLILERYITDDKSTFGTIVGTRSGSAASPFLEIKVRSFTDQSISGLRNVQIESDSAPFNNVVAKVVTYAGVEHTAIFVPEAASSRHPSRWVFTGWHTSDTNSLIAVNGDDANITAVSDLTTAQTPVKQLQSNMSISGDVGIGTTAPSAKLEVVGDTYLRTQVFTDTIRPYSNNQLTLLNGGSNYLYVNGNVGIGIATPQKLLHINGGSGNVDNLVLESGYVSAGVGVAVQFNRGGGVLSRIRGIEEGNWNGGLLFEVRNGAASNPGYDGATNVAMKIATNGNVGIGTLTPAHKIDVDGSIRTRTGYIQGANTSADITLDGSIGTQIRYANQKILLNSADVILYTANAERMRIVNGGNVGIGTTSPSAKLHIADDGPNALKIGNTQVSTIGETDDGGYPGMKIVPYNSNIHIGISSTNDNKINLWYGGTNYTYWQQLSTYSVISSYSTSALALQIHGGNVGIGTTSPDSKLQVTSTGSNIFRMVRSQNNFGFEATSTSSGGYGLYDYQASSYDIYFKAGNVGIGTTAPSTALHVNGVITATGGNSTNWNTAYGWGNNYISDVRLAETNLNFTGSGSAFNGTVDLSTLPFAASSHTHSAADITSGTLASARLSGTYAISVSGNAATASVASTMQCFDTRSSATTPQTYNTSIRFDFKANSTNGLSDGGSYNGVMYWRKYGSTTDWTGGGAIEIAYTDNGRLWHRYGSSTSWGSWRRLWNSADFSSTDISNWNTAFGWGNHATASYIKADSTTPLTIQAETVTFSGNVTIEGTLTESSSIRFKENIEPLQPSLEAVNALNPVSYNKIGEDNREIGLIAEDVAELFPEVVTYNEEGQPQGVQYQRLSVILLKAVQELTQEVNELKKKLN